MTLAELKLLDPASVEGSIAYLDSHVNGFEDVRIAVAGLEAVNLKSSKFPEWIQVVEKLKNPDGTYGSGASLGRETGGAVVALLRMGQPAGERSAVLGALRKSQRPDGGWGKDEGASTLESTYRVMRAFYMLKEEPNLSSVKALLESCRSSEGGYGVASGKPADLQGTYYATTILHWVRELEGEPALLETAGFTPLFNGKNLDGWEGDKSIWSVKAGMIVGKTEKLDHNDFLASKQTYGDFVLKASFKLVNGSGNSGIMFRSKRAGSHEMSGYQADVGENYWGSLYDESRRNKTLVAASKDALAKIHPTSWNHYVIRAMGKSVVLNLNGVESVRYREEDASIPVEGALGLQVHAGGPTEVLFKDLYIQKLPSPKEDDSHAFGFHLKTIKVGNESRKYVFFVPKDYDGSSPLGVVLFLHGSGERGEDGVVQSQVGLGPAIMQKPEAFPLFAVFPQAKTTWAADSADAKAALAALDDVVADFMVDSRAIVLTGLSMGGRGAWEIASAHPEASPAWRLSAESAGSNRRKGSRACPLGVSSATPTATKPSKTPGPCPPPSKASAPRPAPPSIEASATIAGIEPTTTRNCSTG